MSDTLDLMASLGNRPMLARSLYLHHQILGPAANAAPRLRRMAGTIVGLPVGADIALQTVAIRPVPNGFDIHENALPSADALFAFVSAPGLRLVMSSESWRDGRILRRLQVLDTQGKPYRRQGPERFMLRYKLSPASLAAREAIVLTIMREPSPQPARLAPLYAWIEVTRGTERRYVDTGEISAGMLGDNEAVRLQVFAPGSLLAAGAAPGITSIHLYLEMTGETIDVGLLGESLLA